MITIDRLQTSQPDFNERLVALLAWEAVSDASVNQTVDKIINDIRNTGDAALVNYTCKFDRRTIEVACALELSSEELARALERIPATVAEALRSAATRITDFHQRQLSESWRFQEDDGTVLGQRITPLDRVGLYVPGGKAAYPSSVLMNALPAKVAGVGELIMVVPAPDDELVYVATAKRAVFGKVGIDMIAGPSEICVVCDGRTDASWIAADLFSQAEHDEQAQAILISDSRQFLDEVLQSMEDLIARMPRADIIRQSLENRGCFIEVADLAEAATIVNTIAPEHLELSVEEPEHLLAGIRHAGAIFMGRYTAEALGDYCAGPNHVLPTSGTARFSSPLGVYDFQKRSSVISCTATGAESLGRTAAVLARAEGLEAHAVSAEARIRLNSGR